MKNNDLQEARKQAGFRELYAMKNGNRATVFINGHKCLKFTYSHLQDYQDANGATFDTVRKTWID